jgi:hypothetical protein
MMRWFLYVSLLASFFGVSAFQPLSAQNARLSRFTASAVDEKVLLDWVVAAGATCDGIGIYRGSDTVGMTLIHYIPGVCGDLARPVTYTFLDSFPMRNQTNYYRLELGPRVFTDFIMLSLIDLGGQTYQFRPHPVVDEANLYLSGEYGATNSLQLYDSHGQLQLTKTFSGNATSLAVNHLQNGLYFFVISRQDRSFQRRGKLLLQR